MPGNAVSRLLMDFGQLRLVADIAMPRFVFVRLQANIELAIEEAGGIGAVVRSAQLRADDGDLRIRHQDVANLRRDLARLFKRDGVRHGGANPQRALVEMRHELAADEGDEQQRRSKDEDGNNQTVSSRPVERPIQLTRVLSLSSIHKQRFGFSRTPLLNQYEASTGTSVRVRISAPTRANDMVSAIG